MSLSISIVKVGPDELGELASLFGASWTDGSPDDPEAPEKAGAALNKALKGYDFLRSDSFRIFMAKTDDRPIGFAAVCLIPKTDPRVGYLYVDELEVLTNWRRQGVATALMEHIEKFSVELGFAGVRLLVQPENDAARSFYESMDFTEKETLLCEKRIDG